jgi:ABC-type multidrug transport system ATPase subunit
VSHVLSEVEQHCDRVAVLLQSRLIHTGPLSSLTGNTKAPAARSLEDALHALYERHAA